jgi:transcriptional regulatory protein RtcR
MRFRREFDDDISRLKTLWHSSQRNKGDQLIAEMLAPDQADQLDRFDRVQLADVLRVCGSSKTLSEAGRRLFNVSRTRRRTANDADRLRKYLAKFNLNWKDISKMAGW